MTCRPKLVVAPPQRLLPKSDFLQIEGVFYDAGGGHSHTENVLFGRQIVRRGHAVYFLQVTVGKRLLSLDMFKRISGCFCVDSLFSSGIVSVCLGDCGEDS